MFNFKKSKLEKLTKFIKKADNKLSTEDKEKIIKLIKPSVGILTKKYYLMMNIKIFSAKEAFSNGKSRDLSEIRNSFNLKLNYICENLVYIHRNSW